MLRDVVVGHTRPRSMPLALLANKSCMGFYCYFMHACRSVPIVMVFRLASGRRSSAITHNFSVVICSHEDPLQEKL